jgi:hypothetical protein
MKKIPLFTGRGRNRRAWCYALIDNEDFALVSRFRWYAARSEEKGGLARWYAQTCFRDPKTGGWKTHQLHRLIMGNPRGKKVDHRSNDGLDNRRCNLRVCTDGQNAMNARKQGRQTSSRYKGVSWNKRRECWVARIRKGKKGYFLGWFRDEQDAAVMYDVAAQLFFGEYAWLNFPVNPAEDSK